MAHLHRLRTPLVLKLVSSNFVDNYKTLGAMVSLVYIAENPRFFGTKQVVRAENCENFDKTSLVNGQSSFGRISRAGRKEAQVALLHYLHYTRSLMYSEAENMSKNSPRFVEKLLAKVGVKGDIGESITRYLRYHPINEFEPFFESLGLKSYEYGPLLPRGLIYLSDNDLLLENYHTLCNGYGIARNKIGRIYKEAPEVFRYDYGVLALKLKAYERLGLSQSLIAKLVVCSPYLLFGDVNVDFVQILEILRNGGISSSLIDEHLLEQNLYNWGQLLSLLNLFKKTGYSDEQLGALIRQHPGILFEGSGGRTLSLIGFLFKFGSSLNQICSMFLHFPQMQVGKFVLNLRKCFLMLTEIEMEACEIGKIVHSHPLLMGSYTLKKANTLFTQLSVGKKRLCKFILENPEEMRKWVIGSRIERLPSPKEEQISKTKMMKTKFLLELGYVENSDKMEKAFKVFRGKGVELQERFDCIVKAGLDKNDVCEMVRVSPQVLNQKKDVLEKKIDFLVNGIGYPLSYLITFPSYLDYTVQRVKLRVEMYNWLKDQGTAASKVSLSTIISCLESKFVKRFVEHHPKGPEVWHDLKRKIYSE